MIRYTAPDGTTRGSTAKPLTHAVAVYDTARPDNNPRVQSWHTCEKLAQDKAATYPAQYRTLVVPVTADGTRSALWAQRITDLRYAPEAAPTGRRLRTTPTRWDIVGRKTGRLVATVDAPRKARAEEIAAQLPEVGAYALEAQELWVAVPHDPARQQHAQAQQAEPEQAAGEPDLSPARAALAYGPGRYPLPEQRPAGEPTVEQLRQVLADTAPPVDVDAVASAMARVPASAAFFARRAEQRRHLEAAEARVMLAEDGAELRELTEALAVARVVSGALDKVVVKAELSARGGIGVEQRLQQMCALVAAPWQTSLRNESIRLTPLEAFAAAGLHDPRRAVWTEAAGKVVDLLLN